MHGRSSRERFRFMNLSLTAVLCFLASLVSLNVMFDGNVSEGVLFLTFSLKVNALHASCCVGQSGSCKKKKRE